MDMNKLIITEIPLQRSFEVMGHTFHNLQEVRDAVSIIGRSHTDWDGRRGIWHEQPANPVPGLYVGLIYEPYPCFDASDYAYENRRYWNFFFSDKPVTEEVLNTLAAMPHRGNYRYVHEDMAELAVPALYWGGDRSDNLLLATI